MSERRTVFRWVRVGDGNPEPAAIKMVDDVRMAFTIGCPDGFTLGRSSAVKVGDSMEPPEELLTEEEREHEYQLARRRQKRFRKLNPHHGYAGFGR